MIAAGWGQLSGVDTRSGSLPSLAIGKRPSDCIAWTFDPFAPTSWFGKIGKASINDRGKLTARSLDCGLGLVDGDDDDRSSSIFEVDVDGHPRVVRGQRPRPGTAAPESSAALLARLPANITKWQTPMLIPPQMPRAALLTERGSLVDYYEIAVRQFSQQILPPGLPATTVWGYGPARALSPLAPKIFHAPSLTIEANASRPVRVKWINELKDSTGHFLPHLLPVDPTLHWANPPGGIDERDTRPTFEETPTSPIEARYRWWPTFTEP